MPETFFEHDRWCHSLPRLPKAPKIDLPSIHGLLPFDGVRNPGSRSSTSHHIWFTYRTEANQWTPKVGICESAAEFAVGLEALLDPATFDVKFQPCTVAYFCNEEMRIVSYTHDFLWIRRDGHRRLVFVRNSKSLTKERVWRQIGEIADATKAAKLCDDFIVCNADTYTRQRRENLFRMWKISEHRNPDADAQVLEAARQCPALWLMRDLFPLVDLPQPDAFDACYRLVAQKRLMANLDNVLWENSRVWVAQ